MAGPYTGTWLASAVSEAEYTGAAKWGTGVNQVHKLWGGPPRPMPNLNIDPYSTPGGEDTYGYVAEDQGWDTSSINSDPELPEYNVTPSSLYGANEQTGTADRPSWGEDTPNMATRQATQNGTGDAFPQWGGSHKTQPAGTRIRALDRGAEMLTSMRVLPNEDVAQGWLNKAQGKVADSRSADDSQVFVQTSDTQRYQTRAGSQSTGRASEYAAPIESRVVGQKLKQYTTEDSARHWDMLPYEQQDYMRPFLSRQAGTGYPEWMAENEMYVSPAIQRAVPADPSLGSIAGQGVTTANDYGYTDEELLY